MIPTLAHGVLDSVKGRRSTTAPGLLGLYGALKDYEVGMLKVIPARVHLALDAASGVLLASSPWLFGFAKEGSR